jgi:soluble lytic murein transglycosylase-like protein
MQVTNIALAEVRRAYPHVTFGDDLLDPTTNIKVGVYYLKWLLEEYKDGRVFSTIDAAAVAYNMGPVAAEKVKHIKLFPYVKKIDQWAGYQPNVICSASR